MRITPEELASLSALSPVTTRRPKRKSIHRLLNQVRRSMRADIAEHMQAPMALLEEAIRFLLAFENFQFAQGLIVENRELAVHTTRLRSDLIAVRELVAFGQESAALAIARVFFENIQIAMGLAIDPAFSLPYGEATKDSDFWSKQIGYGKIYPRVRKFLAAGGGDPDTVDGKLAHHKELKSFLSGHIHPTTSSAFQSAFPPALGDPGMLLERPIGSVSRNLRPLCLTLADEVHMFAACCMNMFISSNPPPALSGYKPSGEMDDFLDAASVLRELIVKYLEPLWQEHRETMAAWKSGLSTSET